MQSQISRLFCNGFRDHKYASIKLQIDNSTFNSSCETPTTVTCSFQTQNGTLTDVCTQPLDRCDHEKTALGCSCSMELANGFRHRLSFLVVKENHTGGSFSCAFNCSNPPAIEDPPIEVSPACLTISVESDGKSPCLSWSSR